MKKKMPKMFGGKSTKLGKGGRFAMGASKVAKSYAKKGVPVAKAKKIAGAVMAKAGLAKYGAKKMTTWAKKGLVKNVDRKI